jgi:hypothetical protein
MNEKDFRAKQIEWDKKSLDERVARWKQLVPAAYDVALPNLAWYFITDADDMYISGHFTGVVLLCAGVVELVLSDQLRTKSHMTEKEVERFGLEQLVILGHRLDILNSEETSQLNGLRKLRNNLVHAKAGKLAQMAKKRYRVFGMDDSYSDAGFYLHPLVAGGVDQDALRYLLLVRDLTVKFYGAKP